jgi:hydroxymethylglutaryl-CoA lyase
MATIRVRDVTPRDGLQGERPIPVADRVALANRLADAGIADIEFGSFVSPKAVPSMAGARDIWNELSTRDEARWWALVPNGRGAQLALDAGVDRLTVTISSSEQYSQKNVGRSTDEAIVGLAEIATEAEGAEIDVVVSCVFGSPFHDVVDAGPTRAIVDRTFDVMPDASVTLADTTGTATPRRVDHVLGELDDIPSERLGLHLHDTRGTALANALAALEAGIVRFDTAVGGLGGSPFAPGAGGNLATEDLVLVLHDLGHDTGIDLDALVALGDQLTDLVGHDLPGRVIAAGPLPDFGPLP